jgi:hypothetical protein
MLSGHMWVIREKKNYPETDESGQFWRSTLLDMDSRLRVARAIAKDETQASIEVFKILKRRGHPDGPPPTLSDGWGGIDQAMIEVYGLVPEYGGHGRPPTRKRPGSSWLYLQMVKQRDERGHFQGVKIRAIFGSRAELIALLGRSTAYIERSQLTSRLFNGRQRRRRQQPGPGRRDGSGRRAQRRRPGHHLVDVIDLSLNRQRAPSTHETRLRAWRPCVIRGWSPSDLPPSYVLNPTAKCDRIGVPSSP